MNYDKVLDKIESGELTSQEAYEKLFANKLDINPKPGKRAHFIKMKIVAPDEGKAANTLLKVLFFIPFPMMFARLALRFAGRFIKDEEFNVSEISKMLKYSKNTRINVDSKDAQVDIKIM